MKKFNNVKFKLLGENEEIVNQISSYVEMVTKFNLEELAELINNDLRMKVYLVGPCITAADIIVYAYVVRYAQKMQDFEKYVKCNLIRWVNHLQSLPGLSQCSEKFGLKVSFPNKKYENLSKRILKKMVRRKTIRELTRQIKDEQRQQHHAPLFPQLPYQADNQNHESEEDKLADSLIETSEEKLLVKYEAKSISKKHIKDDNKELITQLDIRVGKINQVWQHPDSDKLYFEEIDIGECKPRIIATGIKKFLPVEMMKNSDVLVVANMKPKRIAGLMSQGMVLTVENEERTKKELLVPPKGSNVGDILFLLKKLIFYNLLNHIFLKVLIIKHNKRINWISCHC